MAGPCPLAGELWHPIEFAQSILDGCHAHSFIVWQVRQDLLVFCWCLPSLSGGGPFLGWVPIVLESRQRLLTIFARSLLLLLRPKLKGIVVYVRPYSSAVRTVRVTYPLLCRESIPDKGDLKEYWHVASGVDIDLRCRYHCTDILLLPMATVGPARNILDGGLKLCQ